MNGVIELETGIATIVSGFRDLPHQIARPVCLHHFAGCSRMRAPLGIGDHGLHKLVGHTHRVVGVLKEDRAVLLLARGGVPKSVVQQLPQTPEINNSRSAFDSCGMAFWINVPAFHWISCSVVTGSK
jgi:hypothetical protein